MREEERDLQAAENEQEPPADSASGGAEAAESPQDELARERDQFRTMAQRAQADFINYKRRAEEERQDLVRNAASRIILQLLPIVDDFRLALEHLPPKAPASWSEGVHMILRKLQGLLEAEGVKGIEPSPGEPLDPFEHDAVFYESADGQPPGAIVRVVRPGYRLNDRVLRPAQVTVAQAETEEAE